MDPGKLVGRIFEPVHSSYVERDAILYALGLGLPEDPLSKPELDFLLEDRIKILPTFAVTLATLGMWVKEPALGIDWVRVVHAAQSATFHRPLPPRADVIGKARIDTLYDRGADKGALCVVRRDIVDAQSGVEYCSVRQTIIMRGDGGFGGERPPATERHDLPGRPPDHHSTVRVSPRAALIYRLSGDLNPLHADPEIARKAGFERPILQGLASYGMVGAKLLSVFCNYEPAALKELSMRFVGVVMPGDRLELMFWREGGTVVLEGRVDGRVVLDQGTARLAPPC